MNAKSVILLVLCFFGVFGAFLLAEQKALSPTETQGLEIRTEPTAEAPTAPAPTKPAPTEPESRVQTFFFASAAEPPVNEEWQIYAPSQVRFQADTAILTADWVGDGSLYSGKLESRAAFRYGTFSFRVDLLEGAGLFPAIWMLPADGSSFPEVDIFEMIGSRPYELWGVRHYDPETNDHFIWEYPEDAYPDSVVVEFTWTPAEMTWSIDGVTAYTMTEDVPQDPMYLLMNLAVGGIWPGQPTEETEFPAEFRVEVLKFRPEESFIR